MAFAHYLAAAAPVETSKPHLKSLILAPPLPSLSKSLLSLGLSSFSNNLKVSKLSFFPKLSRSGQKVKAKPQDPEVSPALDPYTEFKHFLLPITDRNPYLSEGTRKAIATTASLVKKYGGDITVIVINEKEESSPEHETQLSSIRWHLTEGGSKDFMLVERLGEGKKSTAIIGEFADDFHMDLVVMSMEAIHSKHVDGNLLAEFIPCPVLLLPL